MAETVGSLVDKISIVELKIYHMALQTQRTDAAPAHLDICRNRLAVLQEQRNDLVGELNDLAGEVLNGKKRLKIYRQFKMYNDPAYRVKA